MATGMATAALGSHRKRYKLGTKKLISWLIQTVRKVARSSGERLKMSVPFTVKDLVRLATRIRDADPKVSVPLSILMVLQDVIKGRSWCAKFFIQVTNERKCSSGDLADSNKRHQHFISQLEEVQALLKSLDIEMPSKSGTKNHAKNTFDLLDLEELDETSNAAPAPAQTPQVAPNPALMPELEEDPLQARLFAVWCAFQDMYDIRMHMRNVWKQYHNGEISFVVASRLTDDANNMILHLDLDLEEADSYFNCYENVADLLGLEVSMGSETVGFFNGLGQSMSQDCKKGRRDDILPSDLFCVPAWAILKDFRFACKTARGPQEAEARRQIRLSNHPLAALLRQQEHTIRVMADHADIDRNHHEVRGFVVDDITYGLMIISHYDFVPSYVVAQFQIFMDAFDAIGRRPQTGHEMLLDDLKSSAVSTRMDGYFKHAESDAAGEAERIKWIEHLKEIAKSKMGNAEDELKSPECFTGTFDWPEKHDPKNLLAHFPFLAGGHLGQVVLGRCAGRIKAVNEDPALLGVAHIYLAAKSAGLIKGRWPDMETVLASQTMHGGYVREGNDVQAYARLFEIAIGIPATKVSKKASQTTALPNIAKVVSKMKKFESPSSYVLSAWEARSMASTTPKAEFYRRLYLTAQRVYGGTMNVGQNVNLTPPELLKALQKSLTEDEVYLKFDYRSFAVRCRIMLQTAHRFARGLPVKDVNAIVSVNPTDRLKTIHEALWEAAAVERKGLGWKAKTSTVLAVMASSIQDLIDGNIHSATFLSVAQYGSSGYITAAQKPRNRWEWGGSDNIQKTVFGPETPEQAKQREKNNTQDQICNSACAQYRQWQRDGMAEDEILEKLRPWMDERLLKGGTDSEVRDITIVDDEILVSFRYFTLVRIA